MQMPDWHHGPRLGRLGHGQRVRGNDADPKSRQRSKQQAFERIVSPRQRC
jgi:hypothetical protein